MILIEQYITKTKEERQSHINLNEPCIERGGPQNGGLSTYCKGLMAHLLDTTIPSGHKIHVCHACNNGKCSNPHHMYWGTAQENKLDQGASASPWHRMVAKYGIDEARKMQSKGKAGNTNGTKNKNIPKTEDQKKKISEAITRSWEKRKS